MTDFTNGTGVNRRSVLLGSGAALGAMALSGIAYPSIANAAGVEDLILETVTGPVKGADIQKAMAHEHLFVDFHGPNDAKYMDVDWSAALGASVNSAEELRGQGVNLLIEWTNIGVGRNILLLRHVSRETGLNIVCPTGIYKSLVPPAMADLSVPQLADHFIRELTLGIDGTKIRAGFIKIAASTDAVAETEVPFHRAAAIAAKETGCTIALHCPKAPVANDVTKTLQAEGFKLDRFVWGHSQPSKNEDHLKMVERGATVQFDAISADSDPFFNGPTDDASMLDRIANITDKHPNQVIVSADASVFVNPPVWQYDRDNTYVYRYFEAKLTEKLGKDVASRVLRGNVIEAFRRGNNIS
jgi:predicted metal-dependent phosphotriesterase family hydrolase